MPTVTVYTRAGCHLCAEAEQVVAEVAAGVADVELVDIDSDPALVARYTVRVPVVAVDGVEIAEFTVSPPILRAALAHSRVGYGGSRADGMRPG